VSLNSFTGMILVITASELRNSENFSPVLSNSSYARDQLAGGNAFQPGRSRFRFTGPDGGAL
jgi:hypothetical protein